MTDNFKNRVVQTTAQDLMFRRRAAELQFEAAQVNGDEEEARDALKVIAQVEAEGNALNTVYRAEMARQNPQRVPETESEFMNRAPERMTYNDTMRINSRSKYKLDPKVEAANLQRGIAELNRRKASGDIQT